MRYFTQLICAALFLAAPAAHAACKLGEFTKENTYALPGCPAEVKVIVSRMYGCIHWSGEEPYDADRAREIGAAMAELRCDSYLDDYSALGQKYKDDAAVSRVLTKAFPLTE